MIILKKVEKINLEEYDEYNIGICELCFENTIYNHEKINTQGFYKMYNKKNEFLGYICPECIKDIKQIKD